MHQPAAIHLHEVMDVDENAENHAAGPGVQAPVFAEPAGAEIIELPQPSPERLELDAAGRTLAAHRRSHRTLADLAGRGRRSAAGVLTAAGNAVSAAGRLKGASSLGEKLSAISAEVATHVSTLTGAGEQATTLAERARNAHADAEMVAQAADDALLGTARADELSADTESRIAGAVAQARDAGGTIRDLSAKSSEIAGTVETITRVAKQTNLLALNAAIEAARAGEHGRGFAVVAEEVRKLADESRRAAASISTVIDEILSAIDVAAASVDASAETGDAAVQAFAAVREAVAGAGDSLSMLNSRIGGLESGVASLGEDAAALADQVIAAGGEAGSVATALGQASVPLGDLIVAAGDVVKLCGETEREAGTHDRQLEALEHELDGLGGAGNVAAAA